MYILNHVFINKKSLEIFITKEKINDTRDSILIQIFSSGQNFDAICNVKNELLKLLPNANIIGSSTAGIISNGKILDDKILISFSIFQKSYVKVKGYKDLLDYEIIEDLKKSIITDSSKLMLCFANTFTFKPENFLTYLSKEFPQIKIAGGNGADDYKFESCFVFSNEDIQYDIIFAIIDSNSLQIQEKYILNWLTLGTELTVTKSFNNIIYEINNVNIYEIYKHYLGEDISVDPLFYMMEFPLIFKQNELEIARVPLKINEDNSMIFAGDIKVGTKVKFGYADINYISQYNKNKLLKDINSKNEAIFIYSCSARRSMLGSYLDDEINILNSSGNTTGFITYGEFFYNNSSKSTNLLNVTTTYLLLNENEILPLETIDSTNSTRNYQEIKTKVITSFLRKTTQEELQKINNNLLEQTDKYQNLMKYSSDAIFIVNLEGYLIECSNQFMKMLGLNDEDLKNLHLSDFEALLSKEMINDTIANLGFEPLNFETSYRRKDKTLIDVSVNIVKISLNNTTYVYGSFRDISHKKIFEEQSKLASMGQMIGNIAHQWRQPLSVITTIASSVKLWKENNLDDKLNLVEGMETIMLQSNYLSKTIDDFRDFVKDNKEKNEIPLVKVVEKALNIVHPTLKNNNITLIKNLNDDEILEVYDNQLIQAIINIINNSKDAIKEKLTQNDKRLLFIETKKDKDKLNLIIKDNGKGIPTEVLPKIFEPYFTTKHQSIGTGIGLSMVHKILTEYHLASIHVKNEKILHEDQEHFGACFTISFDLTTTV